MGRLVKNIFIFTTGKAVYNNEKESGLYLGGIMGSDREKSEVNGRFHNIRNEYKINFKVPEILKNLMMEAEEADIRNDGSYDNLADTIDVYAKNSYADGLITKAQWDYIVTRYPQG